jgi:hypothetical protein
LQTVLSGHRVDGSPAGIGSQLPPVQRSHVAHWLSVTHSTQAPAPLHTPVLHGAGTPGGRGTATGWQLAPTHVEHSPQVSSARHCTQLPSSLQKGVAAGQVPVEPGQQAPSGRQRSPQTVPAQTQLPLLQV